MPSNDQVSLCKLIDIHPANYHSSLYGNLDLALSVIIEDASFERNERLPSASRLLN